MLEREMRLSDAYFRAFDRWKSHRPVAASGAAQLTYWDALIVAAAQRSGARYLLSEDLQAGRKFGDVKIVNPFERSAGEFSWPEEAYQDSFAV